MGCCSVSGVRVIGVWFCCLGGMVNPTNIPLLLLLVFLSVVVSVARRLLSLAKDKCLEAGGVLILMGLGVVL